MYYRTGGVGSGLVAVKVLTLYKVVNLDGVACPLAFLIHSESCNQFVSIVFH